VPAEVYAPACLSADRSTLAVADKGPAVRVFDNVAQKAGTTVAIGTPKVGNIALSPDGKRLAVRALSSAVEIFDAKSGEKLFELDAGFQAKPVNFAGVNLCFSRDGKRLLTAEMSGACKLWDLVTKKEVCQLDELKPYGLGNAAFTKDGK